MYLPMIYQNQMQSLLVVTRIINLKSAAHLKEIKRLLVTTSLLILTTGGIVFGQYPVSKLQVTVDKFRNEYKIPGVAVAIIRQDSINYACSGIASVYEDRLINKSSVFHIGSNTKAITAFVAAILVEKGYMSWSN